MPATFDAQVEAYDLDAMRGHLGGPGWTVRPERAALLVHDLLPYYLQVLPVAVTEHVVRRAADVLAWARSRGVPVIASGPRPATDVAQRGLGGRLWGLGPAQDQARVSALPDLHADDVLWVAKRSYSAFFATDLATELHRRRREQLIIVGVFAAAGIVATTFDALAHDVESFTVADATADYSHRRHAAALDYIAETTGQVVSAEQVTSLRS